MSHDGGKTQIKVYETKVQERRKRTCIRDIKKGIKWIETKEMT